jgi:formylglycine-generating enzyme required for sulfatase activity
VQIRAFYLDKYEVTNFEYKQFCDATGHPVPPYWKDKTYSPGLEKHPVTQVTWHDALAYSHWAGKRLPTEAEWERAAKGPNSTRYAYGNAYDPSKANTETKRPTPVGSYPSAGFGACDITGNVAEWTSSLYKRYPYKIADGREDSNLEGPRVVRGGHFSSGERNSRCLVRTEEGPDQRLPTIGFRCARDAG